MRRHFTHVLRNVVIPAVVLAGAGCSALGLDGGTNERARLRAARVKWEQHGIPAYRFTYRRSCFCPDDAPLVIEVQNAAVIEASYEHSDAPLASYLEGHVPTVDTLFATVARAITGRVDLLEVDYHPVLGYPTRIAIDYAFNVADDEIVHQSSDLIALPPD